MKNAVKIFAALALLSMSSLMKSQNMINPMPIENRDFNCAVEITVNEYDFSCNMISSNVLNVGPTATIFWSLQPPTFDVEIVVNWAVNPICTSGVTVRSSSCQGTCGGTQSSPLSFSCCASLTNVMVTCAAGVLIN